MASPILETGAPDHVVVASVGGRSVLGEGPHWDASQQRLYWVDMPQMLVNSYTPATGQLFHATIVSDKKPVTLVIPVLDTEDKFVVALKGSLALMQWDGKSNVSVTPVEILNVTDASSSSRCNDGKADPSNRLWVEIMGAQIESNPKGNKFEEDKGELFRIDFDGNKAKKTKMLDQMQIPNGLEWSLNKDRFYLADSITANVTEYAYNDQEGSIENLKLLYDLKADALVDRPNSLPDGMTIDEEGFLWIAVYGTGKVIRVDPKTYKKVFEVTIKKVLQPTSVCFGGKDLDTLYVTSARVDWTEEDEKNYPDSGKLFKITNLGVKGAGPSRPVRVPKSFLDEIFPS